MGRRTRRVLRRLVRRVPGRRLPGVLGGCPGPVGRSRRGPLLMTTPTPPATGLDAQDLLRRHLAGEDGSDVLSELAGSDPSLAPVLSLLAKRREDAQEPDDDSAPADAPG